MSFEDDFVEDDDINMIDEQGGPESDSEAESLSDSDSEITEKLAEPTKTAIYNRDGLLDKLQDIAWPENVDWTHKLTVEIEQSQAVDVNDDLAREMSFYTQALEGTKKAFEKLQDMGLPFLRPSDYYAEMVKSDTHMEKVKSRLLHEKKQMEETEERRKARDNKKLAKEVQSQKMKERAKQKKDDIESVKKWRKQRQQSGFSEKGGPGELDLEFGNGKSFERGGGGGKKRPGVSPGDRSGGKGKSASRMNNKKREFRDSKFGHGGRKGLSKQNTAETTNDFKGGFKGGKAGGNKRQKRS